MGTDQIQIYSAGADDAVVAELIDQIRRITTSQVQQVVELPRKISHEVVVLGSSAGATAVDLLAPLQPPTRADSYRLRRERTPSGGCVTRVVGADAAGVRFGIYGLLQRLGCSFHLYGDIHPEPQPGLLDESFDILREPRFALRGMQPWCFWYPGRDSWSYEDFDAYLTQFPKMGFNLLDFPLYFYEPLYTGYSYNGQLAQGHHLAGIDASAARFAHAALGDRVRFVSPDVPDDVPQAERSAAAIALMRRVFTRAHEVGVKTCVDIELGSIAQSNPDVLAGLPAGDLYDGGRSIAPSSSSGTRLLRARLEALFEAYPDCDFYGLWQPEGATTGPTSGSPHPLDVAFRDEHSRPEGRATAADFDYLQSFRIAQGIVSELRPGTILVTGGWGGEAIMPLADNLLGPDVVRSTLGYYEPQMTLAQNRLDAYESTTGPTWHITWGEVDQRLWVLQPKTRTTELVLDELERHGTHGALLLHWRNLFPDLDISLFSRACWTAGARGEHLGEWIRSKFGMAAEDQVRRAVDELERFVQDATNISRIDESRSWVGFDCGQGGLLLANRYLSLESAPPERWLATCVRPHLDVDPVAIGHLEHAAEQSAAALHLTCEGPARERLRLFDNRIRYTLALYRAHLVIAQAVLAASDGWDAGDPRDGFQRALELLQTVDASGVARMFAAILGESGPERGEIGLLLSLDVKFVAGVGRIIARIRRALNDLQPVLRPDEGACLSVQCGAASAPRGFVRFEDELSERPERWSPEDDAVSAKSEFGYEVVGDAHSEHVNPDTGHWIHPDRLDIQLTVPPGFAGRIRLYLYSEPDFDTALLREEVKVEGTTIGTFTDFFSRGEFGDEGYWVESTVTADPTRTLIPITVLRRGLVPVRVSALEVLPA